MVVEVEGTGSSCGEIWTAGSLVESTSVAPLLARMLPRGAATSMSRTRLAPNVQ
jgi:hypothetical protein